jgi:NDP-sugar pyrophosphorylase family protein
MARLILFWESNPDDLSGYFKMKAMLLAAGLGTRLRPLTDHLPKCMVPVGGKPILEHTIEWLKSYAVTEVMINLYYLPQSVMEYFGDGSKWGTKITYSVEKEILGTAGGVKKVAQFFEEEAFIVWYGDNLCTCDIERLSAFHHVQAGIATIALYRREDVTQCGIVELDASERILRFLEKPRPEQVFSHWVNAGIYICKPDALSHIPSNKPSDFGRDIFPALLADGQQLYGYRLSEDERFFWSDTLEDLQRTQKEITGVGGKR